MHGQQQLFERNSAVNLSVIILLSEVMYILCRMEKNNKTLFLSYKSINNHLKVENFVLFCFLLNQEVPFFFFLVNLVKNILQAVCQVSFQNKNFTAVS